MIVIRFGVNNSAGSNCLTRTLRFRSLIRVANAGHPHEANQMCTVYYVSIFENHEISWKSKKSLEIQEILKILEILKIHDFTRFLYYFFSRSECGIRLEILFSWQNEVIKMPRNFAEKCQNTWISIPKYIDFRKSWNTMKIQEILGNPRIFMIFREFMHYEI